MSTKAETESPAYWEGEQWKAVQPDYPKRLYYLFHILQAWYKFISKLFKKQVAGENGEVTTKLRWEYPMRILPFVNFMYDLFLDSSSPSSEAVKNLLDILGLLNALLLGAVVSIFTCVGYGDLYEVDQRFMADPTKGYGLYWAKPGNLNTSPYSLSTVIAPSAALEIFASKAISLFFLNIFLIVYTYADGLSKLGAKDESGGEQDEDDAKFDASAHKESLFDCWWSYSKWAIMLCVFCTGAGCIYSILACGVLYLIKYPDYYLERTGAGKSTEPTCPTGQQNAFFGTLFGVVCVVVVGACGMGTARRYSAEDDLRERLVFLRRAKKLEEQVKNAEKDGDENVDTKRFKLVTTLIQWAHLSVACDEWADFRHIMMTLKGLRHNVSGKALAVLQDFYKLVHKNGNIKWGLELHESEDQRFSKRVEALISSASYLPKEYELRGASRVAPDVEGNG